MKNLGSLKQLRKMSMSHFSRRRLVWDEVRIINKCQESQGYISSAILDSALQSLITLRRNDLGHVLNHPINSKVLDYGWKGKRGFDFVHGERIISPCTETWWVDGWNGFSNTNFSYLSWRTILTSAAFKYRANANLSYLNSSLCCWKWVVST